MRGRLLLHALALGVNLCSASVGRHCWQVLELQAPGKRVVPARDYINGLKGRTLMWQPAQLPAGAPA